MKKVLGLISGVVFVFALLVTTYGDPDPPPGHLHASVEKVDIINTYSDPDPPPGRLPI